MSSIEGAALMLPVVYFDDLRPGGPYVMNQVTFQLDLSAQFPEGAPPSSWSEGLRATCLGSFNAWNGSGLTNNFGSTNNTFFSGTVSIISLPETRMEYRFEYVLMSSFGGWGGGSASILEQPLSTGGANRSFSLLATNGALVLPVVRFGDLQPNDLLPAATLVRLRLEMAGARGADGHVFDPAVDRVFVNGDFVWWDGCASCSGSSATRDWAPWYSHPLSQYQMTNIPGTQVYSATVAVSPRDPVVLSYRYSINGSDNETHGRQNHLRYIRATGEYELPLDTFVAPVQEQSFGDLKAALSDPQHLLISWLGRPGVRLQSRASPETESWEDHPETDGLSATNWLTAEGGRWFRLVRP